jgi:hypothetical protein
MLKVIISIAPQKFNVDQFSRQPIGCHRLDLLLRFTLAFSSLSIYCLRLIAEGVLKHLTTSPGQLAAYLDGCLKPLSSQVAWTV